MQIYKKHESLIRRCEFTKLYELASASRSDEICIQYLTLFLLDCGVNPLDHMGEIFADMFYCVEFPEELSDLHIPLGYTEIYNCDFYNTGLDSIYLPNSIKSIGLYAFKGCSLSHIYMQDSITSIDLSAFEDCHYLEEIHIPKSVKYIGLGAFNGCSRLKKIYVSKDLDLSMANVPEDCEIIRR